MLILALLLTDPAILSPQPWQVLQRTAESAPTEVTSAEPAGTATVELKLSGKEWLADGTLAEYRLLPAAAPSSQPATAATATPATVSTNWRPLALQSVTPPDPGIATTMLTLPSGGWYRLEVRLQRSPPGPSKVLSVEPIGVGEVFLIAGQSYATNTNDQRLQVMDSRRRVSAYHWETSHWQLADDPQPAPDRSDGGSIWPPVGDRLAQVLDVPVGFVNVAVGGTSTRQWSPDGPLSARLHRAGQNVGRFRAVLWQQGESD
ncbi:MAG: sialate O-acetylesterase, partial [Planctomycetaceae bacterium]